MVEMGDIISEKQENLILAEPSFTPSTQRQKPRSNVSREEKAVVCLSHFLSFLRAEIIRFVLRYVPKVTILLQNGALSCEIESVFVHLKFRPK